MNDLKKIDVVIIATIRPDILKITLNSFKNKLLNKFDVRVIVNVDPIGESGYTQNDIVEICREYFPNIVSRVSTIPSFSAAVQWCWSQVDTDYFFHLEDDWCLKSQVSVSKMIALLSINDVVSVRLNVTRNSKFTNNGSYAYSNGLSLNPSMMKSAYIKELLQKFDINKDPEKQFSGNEKTNNFICPLFLLYGNLNDKSIVIDTGTKWRENIGISKWNKTGKILWNVKNKNKNSLYLKIKYNFFIIYWRFFYCN